MLRYSRTLVLTCMVLSTGAALAQGEPPARLVGVSQVVEEMVHPIRIFKYEPAYKLDRAAAEKTGPEATVAAWIEAMRRNDYKAALRYWDTSSQALIEERGKVEGLTEENWTMKWRALYGGRETQATDKVQFGSAWLIQYEVVDASKKIFASEPVVLVKQGERWLLTLKYADHAVVQGWNVPTKRVHRLSGDRLPR